MVTARTAMAMPASQREHSCTAPQPSPMAKETIDHFCDNPRCVLHIPYEDGKPWASICLSGRCPDLENHYPQCDRCLVIDRAPADTKGRIYCRGCGGDPETHFAGASELPKTL